MKSFLILVGILSCVSTFANTGQSATHDPNSDGSLYVCVVNGYTCWSQDCWLYDTYQGQSELSKKDALQTAIKLCYDAKNSLCEKQRCDRF